jgi:hypothetical protein
MANEDYNHKQEARIYIKSSISVPEDILEKNGLVVEKTSKGVMYGIPRSFAEKHCSEMSGDFNLMNLELQKGLEKLASEARDLKPKTN